MNLRLIPAGVIPLALAGLWVANCSGPQPIVDQASVRLVEPSNEGTPYRVEAVLRNRGRGQGEVTVHVRLRDRASGVAVQKDEQVDLDPHQSTLVVVEVPAPPSTYVPEVEAEYPPR
jgi:hypothetical protein